MAAGRLASRRFKDEGACLSLNGANSDQGMTDRTECPKGLQLIALASVLGLDPLLAGLRVNFFS